MPNSQEVELKLALLDRDFDRLEKARLIRTARASARQERLTSVYYDTRKCKLRKRGVSLRVRSDGERYLQTIKAASRDLLSRGEWESEIAGATPDLKAARGTALEPLLSEKLRRKLKPVFETQIERQVIPLHADGAMVELSLDQGKIRTGEKSANVCEVEIELQDGDEAGLFRLAHALGKTAPLRLSARSKAERGYELVDGTVGEPIGADEVRLHRGWSTAAAFEAITQACLYQIAANWEAVDRRDPEGFHQMRVGLRRLRAALSIFSDMLGDRQSAHVKKELKWLTNELGPARQIDVFSERALAPLLRTHVNEEGVQLLAQEVARRRSEAEVRAKASIDSTRFRELLLKTAEWIQTGDWRKADDELIRAKRERLIDDVAIEVLTRRHAKVLKRGKKLRELDPQKRHKLRIAAKKLRYVSEFFANLFPRPKARRQRQDFLESLRELQDCLGDLNDVTAHQAFCAGLVEDMALRQDKSCQVAYLAGIVSGREEAQIKELLRSSVEAHQTFSRVDLFWK